MEITGTQILGSGDSDQGTESFTAVNPDDGSDLEGTFVEATTEEVDRAVDEARNAFDGFRATSPEERARFLDAMADRIGGIRDELVERTDKETALGDGRLNSELDRTANQIRMFGALIREGSWVDARIDTATEDNPDVRRMLIPMGPIGVFGAGNFPLAFSVAGGDTASALAAGNPVVVKGHPGHPGTCELVARAIRGVVRDQGLPDGVFSMLQGTSNEIGQTLVRHSELEAVGFTGSLQGGRALYDAASERPDPIPVFAEMGSTNPTFLLPGALEERGETMATQFGESVTLGAGQFCTNPGVIFGPNDVTFDKFTESLADYVREASLDTMLNKPTHDSYEEGVEGLLQQDGLEQLAESSENADGTETPGCPRVFRTELDNFLSHEELREEVFGPSSLLVSCGGTRAFKEVADELCGHLTATLHGTEQDLRYHEALVSTLEKKVGRLIFNGVPTGVRVCDAMQHGGPYPASTDSRFTSVGTAAIRRFVRPVCYQDFPDEARPPELRNENQRRIRRKINGDWTREDV